MKRAAPALEAALSRLAQRQLQRQRTTVEAFAAPDSRVVALAGGRELIDFSSNDYLGLARHPALAAAMSACAARAGAGSGASHLVTGHGAEHERLEEELAAFTATDGVFSMDGDLAPLPQLSRAARARDAWLVVDDAHGLGVVGASGRGALEHFGLGA